MCLRFHDNARVALCGGFSHAKHRQACSRLSSELSASQGPCTARRALHRSSSPHFKFPFFNRCDCM